MKRQGLALYVLPVYTFFTSILLWFDTISSHYIFEHLFYIKHCVGCFKVHKYEKKKNEIVPALPEMIIQEGRIKIYVT